MRALAQARLAQFRWRMIFLAVVMAGALVYVPPGWALGVWLAVVAGELVERRQAQALLASEDEAFDANWRSFVLTNLVTASATGLVTVTLWVFATPAERLYPLGFLFIKTFYVALVTPQVSWLLMVRQGIYAGLAIVLVLRDAVLAEALTASTLITQLLPVLAFAGYVIGLSRWSAFAYRQRLEHLHALGEARDAAEQAREAKATLIATISHELRTPLNGIIGMAQTLLAGELAPAVRRQVEVIAESGRNLNALLNDILDYSKLEAGRLEISPTADELGKTAAHVEHLFRPVAVEKGLDFTVRVGDEVPERLVFDPVRVRQCLANLVSNAIKFTEQGAVSVAVSAEPVEPKPDGAACWRITAAVSDTGIGIPEDQQPRLFAPFSQAEGSIGRRYGGTGLGLSITRHLAEAMGGGVTFESAPGKGSTFRLEFLAEAAREGERQGGGAPGGGAAHRPAEACRVLVADGVETNRTVLRLFLEPLGVRTVEVADGASALSALRRGAFDAAFIDLNMPGLSGEELARCVRNGEAGRSDLPLVAISGGDRGNGREDRVSARFTFDGCLDAPIEPGALRAMLGAVIPGRLAPDAVAASGAAQPG